MESMNRLNPFDHLPFLDGRALGDSEDEGQQNTYLVDADGNAYESYSLAWRYLGMYIDCDIDEDNDDTIENQSEDDKDRQRRKVLQQEKRHLGGSDDNNSNDCSRKVLWAAYRDPRYQGGSIGEYQFYDRMTGEWDDSTCQSGRCVRMNCHEERTHFELVGVFKETDGLYDWAEQLFKHQGYCLWDGDKEEDNDSGDSNDENSSGNYDFMQDEYSDWANYFGCNELTMADSDGNTLFIDARPQAEGNFTYGLYTDEDCTLLSSMTWSEYIIEWYQNYYNYYYNGNVDANEIATEHEASVERWNTLMNDYKICQPCRAYNRVVVADDDDNDEDEDDDQEEGNGEVEQWGYNCYDDAGYRNCDQCHKFMAKTDLEPATSEDLERASAQETILAIKVDGVRYGSGGFQSPPDRRVTIFLAGLAILMMTALIIRYWKIVSKWTRRLAQRLAHAMRRFEGFVQNRVFSKGVRETLIDKDKELWQAEEELQKKKQLIEEQESEMYFMQAQIDHDRMLREESKQHSQLLDSTKPATIFTEGDAARNGDQSLDSTKPATIFAEGDTVRNGDQSPPTTPERRKQHNNQGQSPPTTPDKNNNENKNDSSGSDSPKVPAYGKEFC
jgi:hypothetical protein